MREMSQLRGCGEAGTSPPALGIADTSKSTFVFYLARSEGFTSESESSIDSNTPHVPASRPRKAVPALQPHRRIHPIHITRNQGPRTKDQANETG